jgi:3'-phosphoadenosine 5'-phosphosulfate (PAPS) 3'-phosphatase
MSLVEEKQVALGKIACPTTQKSSRAAKQNDG